MCNNGMLDTPVSIIGGVPTAFKAAGIYPASLERAEVIERCVITGCWIPPASIIGGILICISSGEYMADI